jgi:hypothetical protein
VSLSPGTHLGGRKVVISISTATHCVERKELGLQRLSDLLKVTQFIKKNQGFDSGLLDLRLGPFLVFIS